MNAAPPESLRPSFTRGGGASVLRWGSIAVYAGLWGWLLLGLLAAGQVPDAAVCVAGLALVYVVARASGASVRLEAAGGAAAVAAGLTWAAGALLLTRIEPDGAGWTNTAAALFLLPALLAIRARERESAWLGAAGFVLGFVPVFVGAALTGGLLGPISGDLALDWIALGLLFLVAGSVPFALVAIWSHTIARPGAALVFVGAGAYMAVGAIPNASALDLTATVAGALYGAGWTWLGVDTLLRVRPDDRAA